MAFCFLCAAAGFARAEVIDRIVAVVNGEVVTLYDVNQGVKPVLERLERQGVVPNNEKDLYTLKKNFLDRYVDRILLRQEAEKLNVSVSDTEIEKQIKDFKSANGMTEESFVEHLHAERMTRKEYEDQIRSEFIRQRLVAYQVRRKVVVSQEEIEKYYNEHKQDYMSERTMALNLIVLPPDVQPETVLSRVKGGGMSFEAAAREYSVGPGALEGGDLGTLNWNDLAPAWKSALESVGVGQVSNVFDLEGHKAILYVREAQRGDAQPLDQIRDAILAKLEQPKLEERFLEYMEQLRSKAVIDIRL
ncbi:MAG: SurA N-terminal domain-containing protein [Desulfovibrionaceae bacterium]